MTTTSNAPRGLDGREGGQGVVLHTNRVQRVRERVGFTGDHDRDRLAHVAHPVGGEDRHRERPALVRSAERRRDTARDVGEIGGAPGGQDARALSRGGQADRSDPRVGVRGAHDTEMGGAGTRHVIDEPSAAGEEATIFLAEYRLS